MRLDAELAARLARDDNGGGGPEPVTVGGTAGGGSLNLAEELAAARQWHGDPAAYGGEVGLPQLDNSINSD